MIIKNENIVSLSNLRTGDLLIINNKEVFVKTRSEKGISIVISLIPGVELPKELPWSGDISEILSKDAIDVVGYRGYKLSGESDSGELQLSDIVKCNCWDSEYIVAVVDSNYCLLSINNVGGDEQILKSSSLEELNSSFKKHANTFRLEKLKSDTITLTILSTR